MTMRNPSAGLRGNRDASKAILRWHAARGLRDTDDIEVLDTRCGRTSAEEAIDLYEAH